MIEHSDNIADLAKSLIKAQKEMGVVTKKATGQVGQQKYKYADLGDVLEVLIPTLNSNDMAFIQGCGGTSDGVAVVTSEIIHESGQWIRSSLSIRSARNDAQGMGSAITYARRYGATAMGGIAPEDDDGREASKPPAPRQAPKAVTPPSPMERESRVPYDELNQLASEAGIEDFPGWLEDYTQQLATMGGYTVSPLRERKKLSGPETFAVRGRLKAIIESNIPPDEAFNRAQEAGMSHKQHMMLFALHKALGHSDEDRKEIYSERFGKDSSKELSAKEASLLIDEFQKETQRYARNP